MILKPQDIVILLKLIALDREPCTYLRLASASRAQWLPFSGMTCRTPPHVGWACRTSTGKRWATSFSARAYCSVAEEKAAASNSSRFNGPALARLAQRPHDGFHLAPVSIAIELATLLSNALRRCTGSRR